MAKERSVLTKAILPPAGKDGDGKQMTGTSKMPPLQTLELPALLKSVLDNVGHYCPAKFRAVGLTY